MRLIPWVVAAFLGLHLLAPLTGPACLWGVDSLVYEPAGRRVLFAGATALLFVFGLRRRFLRRLRTLDLSRRSGLAVVLLLVAGGAALFTGLRTATPLLGDGQLHLNDLALLTARNLRFSDVSWANLNAPLSTWIVAALHRVGGALWSSPETTYRLFSVISGLLFIALCPPVARLLGRGAVERAVLVALLLTGGYLQLFCGYVETYALVLPLLLLYAGSGLLVLTRGAALWVPAAVLGVLIPLHFTLATLVPSLVLLAALGAGSVGAAARRVALALGATAVVSVLLLAAIRFDLSAYLQQPRMAFLPLLAEPGARQSYRLLTGAHVLDVLNQYALAAPAALLALPLLRASWLEPRDLRFLFSMAVFPVLFTCVANPEVGAFRDWDAFAYPALALTLWAAAGLMRSVRPEHVASVGLLVAGAAGLHTLAWIDVNANAQRAEARFRHLLTECRVSQHARSYGWESLGSFYLRERRLDPARVSFENAARISGDNPRLWVKAGELSFEAERIEEAIRLFSEALTADPHGTSPFFPQACLGRGIAHFRRGEFAEAARDLERTIARRPGHARAHYHLGLSYWSLGRLAEAEAHLVRAKELEPAGPRSGDLDRWIRELREAGRAGENRAPTGRS